MEVGLSPSMKLRTNSCIFPRIERERWKVEAAFLEKVHRPGQHSFTKSCSEIETDKSQYLIHV